MFLSQTPAIPQTKLINFDDDERCFTFQFNDSILTTSSSTSDTEGRSAGTVEVILFASAALKLEKNISCFIFGGIQKIEGSDVMLKKTYF